MHKVSKWLVLMGMLVSFKALALANPASVYCTVKAFDLLLLRGVGICTFPDKSYCEEWRYYRGECFAHQQYWPQRQQDKQHLDKYCLTEHSYQITLCTEQTAQLVQAIQTGKLVGTLDLRRYTLTPAALSQIFTALQSNTAIHALVINKPLSAANLTSLSALLAANSPLSYLAIQDIALSSEDFKALATAISRGNSLKELSLRNTQLTDGAFKATLPLLLNSRALQALDLPNNQLTDASGVMLSKTLMANKHLLQINLSFNPLSNITAQGLLVVIQHNPTLVQIGLQGTKVSDDLKTKLTAILAPRFHDSSCLTMEKQT